MNLLRIALRNVFRNKRRTAISVFAIFIGIGVMVAIRGFVNGFQRSLVTNTVEARLGAVQIHKKGFGTSVESSPLSLDFEDSAEARKRLLGIAGVRGVAARIHFPIMVNRQDTTVFALATAIEPLNEYAVCPEEPKLVATGKPLSAEPGILVSTRLAKALGAALGDKITLLGNDRDGALNGIELPLTGVYESRMPGLERTIVVTLPDARTLLRMDGRATELAIGLKIPEEADRAAADAQALVGNEFEASSWRVQAKLVTDIMKFQNTILSVISGIFLLVALTGIVNTMLMTVLERVREIGTMMAIGVRRKQIVFLFLAESAVMGWMGGVAGAAAGLAVTIWLGRRGVDISMPGMTVSNVLRPYLLPPFLAAAVVLAVVGATAAAVYPALRASKMRPVEALQHT